jgi:hypothetical protein
VIPEPGKEHGRKVSVLRKVLTSQNVAWVHVSGSDTTPVMKGGGVCGYRCHFWGYLVLVEEGWNGKWGCESRQKFGNAQGEFDTIFWFAEDPLPTQN